MKKILVLATFCTLPTFVSAQNLKILNAASLTLGSVAPGSIVTITGNNLSSQTVGASDTTNPPTSLGGVTVTVGGSSAALLYVSPRQINAVLSPSTPVGSEPLVVSSGGGQQTGIATVAATAAPGLFSLSGAGTRQGLIIGAGVFVGGNMAPQSLGGTYVALFGTGISLSSAPKVTVGGVPATVTFYGPAPCCSGAEQVNIIVPQSSIGAGRLPVVLTSNGQASNSVQLVIGPTQVGNATVELAGIASVPNTSLVVSSDQRGSVVRVIDVSSQKVTETVSLAAGSNPTDVAVNSAGTQALVTEAGTNKVAVINLNGSSLMGEITVDKTPVAVAMNGSQAVVANQDADTVSLISLANNTVQKSIPVGHAPVSVAVDGNSAYVLNQDDGTFSTIDLTALAVTKTIPLGFSTRGESIALIPGAGIAYVTVPASGPEGRVLAVNLSSGAITQFDTNVEASAGSTAIVYYNSKLYLTNPTLGSITVANVNPSTGAISLSSLSTVQVGLGPSALAIDVKDNLLVVSNQGSSTLTLVNLANDQVTQPIPVGGGSPSTPTSPSGPPIVPVGKTPAVTKVSPSTAKAGATITLTLTGRNLTAATAVSFLVSAKGVASSIGSGAFTPDTGFKVSNIQVTPDGTQLTASVTIASTISTGMRIVQVTTPNGKSTVMTTILDSLTITK